MNKQRVNQMIPYAYDALRDAHIVRDDNTIVKTFRGQISTFGAAITGGSLEAAIAFFSKTTDTEAERSLLLKAILKVLKMENESIGENNLFVYAQNHSDVAKEDILNAAIAIKLAMNLYELV